MKPIDWFVLLVTLICIIVYGVYKSRTQRNLEGYFLSNRSLPWYMILLSIMGTQASAVTFLSAPGQAYTDGMRFVQYYFGLPLAAIVICISFVPVFHKLKVYTAYEYLENRFDVKTRALTSFLFLFQRALSTGISVFAPSIILSALLGWNIYLTNIVMGGLLIIYTVTGGAKAVAYTQQLQFVIIMLALTAAGYFIVAKLPASVGFGQALAVGGKLGRMQVITTGFTEKGFNWGDRYNIFSGLIGGFFLALSYFGTDQSQVGRYLTAKNMTESRMGLLLNGMVKIPMQFFILLIGVLVFTFYQFHNTPVFFNGLELRRLEQSKYAGDLKRVNDTVAQINYEKKQILSQYASSENDSVLNQLKGLQQRTDIARSEVKNLIKQNGGSNNDTNYIFLKFVLDYMPEGLVGLIIAVIFLASWGSIAAALNSLASSTMIDFHRRFRKREETPLQEYKYSQYYTLFWGVLCIAAALLVANWSNSLIEVVNILGSLFYGTVLGVFLVAFYMKKVKGTAVFYAAIVTELIIIVLFLLNHYGIIPMGFLWLNAIGALLVMLFAMLLQWAQNLWMNKAG